MSTLGAAAVVNVILTSLQQAANQASAAARTQVSSSISNAKIIPDPRTFLPTTANPLPDLDLGRDFSFGQFSAFRFDDLELAYGAETNRIATKLREDYALILNQAFPTEHFTKAEEWIKRTLKKGETTLNTQAENQAWTRGRSQLLQQAAEADEATMLKWAVRGFPFPPGGMVHEMSMTEKAAQEKIGELSRSVAVEAFNRELDNVRTAIERAIELRKFAVTSSIDYMREYVEATEFGLDVTKNTQAAHARLSSTAYEYFKYLEVSQDWSLEVGRFNSEEQNKRELKTDEYQMRVITAVVNALISRFTGLQSAASSALNGLRGEARVSGQDTTRIEIG